MKIKVGEDRHIYEAEIDKKGVFRLEDDPCTWLEVATSELEIVDATLEERQSFRQHLEEVVIDPAD